MSDLLQAVLAKLDRGGSPDSKWPNAKGEYWALCPFHSDTHPDNFSVSAKGFKCFACGEAGGLAKLAGKVGVALMQARIGSKTAPLPPTLENYAQVKDLPIEFLESLGLQTVYLQGKPVVKMPYYDAGGTEAACRFRIAFPKATEGPDNRFKWRSGAKVMPYGLWRLDRAVGYVILCEGESDSQTFWYHGIVALGIPGASNWKPEWAQDLTGLTVYVWRESDQGGATFAAKVGESLPDCRIITPPQGRKDISDCHLAGDDVAALVENLKAAARPWREIQAERLNQRAAEAKQQAVSLLECSDLLAEFGKLCRDMGLVGEERTARLLYLAVTSRLLARPISVVVKGPSSGGKSYTVETVLKAFPPTAFYALSSMSDRSLAYSDEPLAHRILVLYEAAGLTSDFGTYLMRTLLSEGCIRYETVEKTADGLKPKLIERAGPTGLIITTTWASLHPENETRMFSVTVLDTPTQTAGVLQSLADRANGREPKPPDFTPWHALQTWLELVGCREVTIPFAHDLAALADARAVRLRRDFGAVLNLIRAHAILHQVQRQRDQYGRIIATLNDYRAAYDLVIEIIGEGVQSTVSANVRQTVEAVTALGKGEKFVTVKQVADHLGIDKSAASRRVRVAIEFGYLINHEDKKGKPLQLGVGDPLPGEASILPHPDRLTGEGGGGLLSPQSTVQPCNRSSEGGGGSSIPPINRATVQPLPGKGPEKAKSASLGVLFEGSGPESGLEDWQLSYLADAEGVS